MTTRPLVLLTGAGRRAGIGTGIARRLVQDGWDVAFCYSPAYDRRRFSAEAGEDAKQLLEELLANDDALPPRASAYAIDLEQPDAAQELVARVRQQHGAIRALVLAHCESVPSTILDTSLESFDRHFAVNARASWQLIREFALQLPQGGGSIVALTSDHTLENLPYGASKAALDRIVLAAARELGPKGVTANVLNPGPVDTGWMNDASRAACLARQPGGRLGTPSDIAGIVSFLLSEEGRWINGQLLKGDGGFSA